MSLMSSIVAAFNPRGTATPAPSQAAARPASAPATSIAPVQQEPDPRPAIEPKPAADAPPVHSPVLIEEPAVSPSTPASAVARANTMQEIALHQFAAVRLRPAATHPTAMPVELPVSRTASPPEQPQGEPAVQTASVYTQAVSHLMVERGLSAEQRIVQLL